MNASAIIHLNQTEKHRNQARQIMARHAKSFNWAAKLFPGQTLADVAVLYAFCRSVDDIADTEDNAAAQQKLEWIRADMAAAHIDDQSVRAFADLVKRTGIDPEIPRWFMDAIISDVGPVRVTSWDSLICYAYGVASTVGLMMCAVMGVRNPAAQPYAVDLGIAMQLTNIARDVVEDARRNRVYLPEELLGSDLDASRIVAGDPLTKRRVAHARRLLLNRADDYYRSADRGMRFIPLRARLAVAVASRLYEAIGGRVLIPTTNWGERAYVGAFEKIYHTVRGVGSVLFDPRYWHTGRLPDHDGSLHRPLVDRPGVNGGYDEKDV